MTYVSIGSTIRSYVDYVVMVYVERCSIPNLDFDANVMQKREHVTGCIVENEPGVVGKNDCIVNWGRLRC